MTEGDEKYKLGELTADMAAVKRDIVDIKSSQKEILHRLDNLHVVSVERWEKRNAYVDAKLESLQEQITTIQEERRLEANSTWAKIRVFIDSTSVRVIGTALFGVIVIAVLYYVQKSMEYGEMIRDYQSTVKK